MWRRQWHPTPVLLPGKSHGRRSLVGCCLWGRTELDTTKRLHFHFSLSCIGEGNGNPLQCSCLENPRDGGAWWAAISGVAHSQTRLKQLSSSSSSSRTNILLGESQCPCLKEQCWETQKESDMRNLRGRGRKNSITIQEKRNRIFFSLYNMGTECSKDG